MSEPIKVGDLVVVARACCQKAEKYLGRIFVAHTYSMFEDGPTNCCHRFLDKGPAFNEGPQAEEQGGWTAWYLKKIPPLSELESEKKKDEVPA